MSDWVSAYYKAYDGAESVLWVSSVLSTSMLKLSYAGRRQNNDSSETFWQISAVFIILTLWPGPMTSEAAAISLKMGLIVSRLLLNEVNAQSIFALLKCHTARLCLFCMHRDVKQPSSARARETWSVRGVCVSFLYEGGECVPGTGYGLRVKVFGFDYEYKMRQE